MKKKNKTFNSGLAVILDYEKSTIKANRGQPFEYFESVAGYKRRYIAEIAGHTVSKVVNVPLGIAQNFMVDDLLEVRDFRSGQTEVLKVIQTTPKYDAFPPTLQITLERGTKAYGDERKAGQSLASL
ncbi:hypothetical protein [Allobaculum stercoricanis]|uniref:hypothetical protein n=1 Tax=Allobaculum stercoricanis TaxID=174709 RepID=UPI0029439C32|nr:hypothetical protein [Allobaculum stercoricanis]